MKPSAVEMIEEALTPKRDVGGGADREHFVGAEFANRKRQERNRKNKLKKQQAKQMRKRK